MKLSQRRVTEGMELKNRTSSSTEGSDLTTPVPEERSRIGAAKKEQDGGEGFQVMGTVHTETVRPIKVWGRQGVKNSQWSQNLARKGPSEGYEAMRRRSLGTTKCLPFLGMTWRGDGYTESWKKNEQILFWENSSGCRWRRGLGVELRAGKLLGRILR